MHLELFYGGKLIDYLTGFPVDAFSHLPPFEVTTASENIEQIIFKIFIILKSSFVTALRRHREDPSFTHLLSPLKTYQHTVI